MINSALRHTHTHIHKYNITDVPQPRSDTTETIPINNTKQQKNVKAASSSAAAALTTTVSFKMIQSNDVRSGQQSIALHRNS